VPTPQEIRDSIDLKLGNITATLDLKQANYFATHGRYWQGLRTPAEIPVDGATLPIDLDRKPTDQAESWRDMNFALPPNQEMSIEVHTHNGPLGHGYTLIVTVMLGPDRWIRPRGFGPHGVTRDWLGAVLPEADTGLGLGPP